MATQRTSILNVLFGHRIVVSSPPSRLGGDISQQVIGIQETLTFFEHKITFVCQPESPYHVGIIESTRKNSGASFISQDMTPTGISVNVSVPSGSAVWTNSAASPTDFPFDVIVGGERMTVTAITGTASPQTFTVTRAVNGVVKTHQNNDSIDLFDISYTGL